MSIRKDSKLVGTWLLSKYPDSPMYKVNVETEIPNYKNDTYLRNIIHLGCIIRSVKLSTIEITLPNGWNHIVIGNGVDIFIDRWGSERFSVDNRRSTMNFKTRFGYEVDAIHSDLPGTSPKLILRIVDNKYGKVLSSDVLDMNEYAKDLADSGLYGEDATTAALEAIDYVAKYKMTEIMEGWDDISLYWDL